MFFSKPGEYKACGLFSLQHIGLILATLACVAIALKKTVHKSKEEVYKILKTENKVISFHLNHYNSGCTMVYLKKN